MRTIAEIKSDKRIKIVDFGFDGMACYLNDKQYKPPRDWKKIGANWDIPPREYV